MRTARQVSFRVHEDDPLKPICRCCRAAARRAGDSMPASDVNRLSTRTGHSRAAIPPAVSPRRLARLLLMPPVQPPRRAFSPVG